MPPNVPKLRRLTLYQHWKGAAPWQRRNMVLASIMLVWAGVLMVDMHNLKQDPVLRAKLKLDDPDTLTTKTGDGLCVKPQPPSAHGHPLEIVGQVFHMRAVSTGFKLNSPMTCSDECDDDVTSGIR
ncbi:uncharacterized protein HaLaN_15547 [Haematococcus lacustris]|uniref:Uncharacterized protein n=1 Tax=Haematococcus lacustris TaxID=44745 RepID=A0A699ZGZ6_HAELA|nr:uncharacterized protein HaLaN_15547 [Haematococcus lacustris]